MEILDWGGGGICDSCNKYLVTGRYLVAVMNHCICSICFEDWEKRSNVLHKEDLRIEKQTCMYYDKILNVNN